MSLSTRQLILVLVAAAAFAAGLFWNGTAPVGGGLLSIAEARIGRPLTPMSYAGVARRTTRRAVAAGAVAGAAYYGSQCVQVVDAYGRVTTRC